MIVIGFRPEIRLRSSFRFIISIKVRGRLSATIGFRVWCIVGIMDKFRIRPRITPLVVLGVWLKPLIRLGLFFASGVALGLNPWL